MSDEYHVALCSGGTDSIAATHAAMTFGPAEEVVFLDTGTAPDDRRNAIAETVAWLREWCDENGWPFRVVETPDEYAEWVRENGYPGPDIHRIAYIKLKDHAIDKLRKDVDGELHCWTGIRRAESNKRMSVAKQDERGDGRWFWRKPIVHFSDDRLAEYLETFDLEAASVVQDIGRSADCWCGCFGDRAELIDLEAAGFEAHAEWLDSLITPESCPREQDKWAGYHWEKHDFAADDDRQMTLCSSCDRMKTDGGDRE
jgi:3'-phosphoadenosine 5'-phosphosulfate sulfotransferase (PAPS reductase)/FAD synthetase